MRVVISTKFVILDWKLFYEAPVFVSNYWMLPISARPYSIFQGQATDIQIQAEEILRQKKRLNDIYAKHTNKPIELIGKLYDTVLQVLEHESCNAL